TRTTGPWLTRRYAFFSSTGARIGAVISTNSSAQRPSTQNRCVRDDDTSRMPHAVAPKPKLSWRDRLDRAAKAAAVATVGLGGALPAITATAHADAGQRVLVLDDGTPTFVGNVKLGAPGHAL